MPTSTHLHPKTQLNFTAHQHLRMTWLFSRLRIFRARYPLPFNSNFQRCNHRNSCNSSKLVRIEAHYSSYYSMERPTKRARVSPDIARVIEGEQSTASASLASLHRSITPPPRTRSRQSAAVDSACPELLNDQFEAQADETVPSKALKSRRTISSPFQLTHIQGLSSQRGYNVDTVKLSDILGDPMIRECWQFNYLFDVDFLMAQFDEDVRRLVQVKVVHGSWERESANRIRVDVSTCQFELPLHHQCFLTSSLIFW